MQCPKCKTVNSGGAQFCGRCHMTLLYRCPSCAATQRHGGTCDKCGVDFAKYAAMLIAQEQNRVQHKRDKARESASTWKHIILLPLTGGYSLVKYLLHRQN